MFFFSRLVELELIEMAELKKKWTHIDDISHLLCAHRTQVTGNKSSEVHSLKHCSYFTMLYIQLHLKTRMVSSLFLVLIFGLIVNVCQFPVYYSSV